MSNKVVLISGGTKGIGKDSAIELLKQGYKVVVFSRKDENLSAAKKDFLAITTEENFLVLSGDATVETNIQNVVSKTVEKFGRIDILINNAGIGYFRDCDKMDLARFQDMIQTNIVGVALLTKVVTPYMKEQKKGQIINISSISGKVAFSNGEFYSATKFAVMGYSQAIRLELKDFGIKVATICPGMVETDFFDEEELQRRMKIWNGVIPPRLKVKDVTDTILLICNQSERCDIQDLTLMPF